tara:strand:- start:281 stop:1954 length:1674 start_codon:yes stop_codon:yes gene_type:complete
MVVEEGFAKVLGRTRAEGEYDFKRSFLEIALLKTSMALDSDESKILKDRFSEEQFLILNSALYGDRNYKDSRKALERLKSTLNADDLSLLEKSIDATSLDLKNGGFAKYVLPKKALGPNFMADYRGKRDSEIRHSLADKAILVINGRNYRTLNVNALQKPMYESYKPDKEEMQDVLIYVMRESGFPIPSEEFLCYRSIKALKRSGELSEDKLPYFGFPSKKFMEDSGDFYKQIGCDTVEGINEIILSGNVQEVIDASYGREEEQKQKTTEKLLEKGDVKVVIQSGPSSSGKTTVTKDMVARSGLKFKLVTMDMYFQTRQLISPHGDKLYEDPEALDLRLIEEHISMLLDGKRVKTPLYDFSAGVRYDEKGPEIKLEDGEILLLDCFVGMFPTILDLIAPENRFITYIEPFLMVKEGDGSSGKYIERSEENKARRFLRDNVTRNTPFYFNTMHWGTARLNAQRDIRSRMGEADHHFDSSSFYDFPFMLSKYQKHDDFWKLDPKKFLRDGQLHAAYSLHELKRTLNSFVPMPEKYFQSDKLPGTALVREFIGGSVYDAK